MRILRNLKDRSIIHNNVEVTNKRSKYSKNSDLNAINLSMNESEPNRTQNFLKLLIFDALQYLQISSPLGNFHTKQWPLFSTVQYTHLYQCPYLVKFNVYLPVIIYEQSEDWDIPRAKYSAWFIKEVSINVVWTKRSEYWCLFSPSCMA